MDSKILRRGWRILGSNTALLLAFFALGYIMLVRMNTLTPGGNIPSVSLVDTEGRLAEVTDFPGKWVLVDFWFQGCAPCLAEMRQFPRLLEKYGDRLVILSVSIDPESRTRELLASRPGPWGFLRTDLPSWRFYNDKRLVNALGVRQYPTYVLIDPEGNWVASPQSGVLGVQSRLGGLPDPVLAVTLIWDKLHLILGKWFLPLLVAYGTYEAYGYYRRRKKIMGSG